MHLQDVIVRYQLRVVTAISTIHPESAERLHMEQAVRTAILHRAARQAAVPHQIVRAAVQIQVHPLRAATSQAVRAANITAVIRMILTIAATMMSTWMATMIRIGTTGIVIMRTAWMMRLRMIWKMETKGTGRKNIKELLIFGTEKKMV